MRRFTMVTFRNMGVGRDIMEERIMAELDTRCNEELDSKSVNGATVVRTGELFELMVGSVINSLLVGKRFDERNKSEFLKMRVLIDSLNETFTIFDMISPVWLLKHFFPKRFKFTADGMAAITDYISREAKQRMEDLKSGRYILDSENPKDFVDAFLAKMEAEPDHHAYTMKSLKHVLTDLWLAGHDTTATTLISGFNHLVHHPEVIKKVQKELMKITENGSRPLSLKDRTDTPYLNATIAEIQRHASILNVNFWKIRETSTKVNGYELPKP